MAIKLLHTGDLHLGASFAFLGQKGQKQRQKLLTTLDKIVDLAIGEKVSLFLIAGDLFDSNSPSYTTIDRTVDALQKLEQAGIPVCLVPGSHDHDGPCSIYNLYDFSEALPNLTVLAGETNRHTYDQLDLTVYGQEIPDRWRPNDHFNNFTASAKTKYHIGLLHGLISSLGEKEEDQDHVFNAHQIKNSGMNYVALGHHHSFTNCSQEDVKAFYCGSPSMLELHKNHGHVVLVTIQPSGETDVQPRLVSHSYYKKEQIAVEHLANIDQLKEIIKTRAHPQVFYEIQLTGKCSLDLPINQQFLTDLEKDFESAFLRLTIVDDTRPKLDEAQISLLPESTVLSQFINLMKDEISKSDSLNLLINEKALKLGFALLSEKGSANEYPQNITKQV
jgi:exonuclease SbcD